MLEDGQLKPWTAARRMKPRTISTTWVDRARARARVEAALERLGAAPTRPAGLGEAMRYARARRRQAPAPAAGAGGVPRRSHGDREARAARRPCAVELIHAYSLVHDDMPCMDNDVLRRGKPTVHVQFGEAQAMLAGDAMQALAFEVLTPAAAGVSRRRCRRGCARLLARAAGHAGMAGGQAIDLASVGQPLDEHAAARHAPPQDRRAAAGQRADGRGLRRRDADARWEALADYGEAIGLAFQVVDDILDVTQASETLGKTAGKDVDAQQADLRVGARPRGGARACAARRCATQAHAALAAQRRLAARAAPERRWPTCVVDRDS